MHAGDSARNRGYTRMLGCAAVLALGLSASAVAQQAPIETGGAAAPEPAPPPPAAPEAPAAEPPASPSGEDSTPPSPPAPAPEAQQEAAPSTPDVAPPPAQPQSLPQQEIADPSAPAEVPLPMDPEPIDTITVVGTSLSKTAGAAYVISERQLERFQYDDPHAALMQVPGLYVRQEDGIGLRPNIGLRGANPDRSKKVTLLEDGVLFGPAPYSAPAAYYFPVITRMTQIRVIDGPASIAYGPQTVGGAIDFSTRAIPDTTAAMLDLAGGEYGYRKAHGYFGVSEGHFGFLVEGLHLHNGGFKHLPSGADTGMTRNEWMVKAAYRLDSGASASHELRLKLTYSDEVSNETYLGLSDADLERDPDLRYPASALDQMKNHRSSLVFTHVMELPSALTLTTTLYRHDYARVWRKLNRFVGMDIASVLKNPDGSAQAEYYAVLTGAADSATGGETLMIGPNDRTFVNQGVQSVLSTRFATSALSHRFEAGLRLHNDSIVRRHSEDPFLMTDGELLPEGGGTIVWAANEASSYALAAHVLDAITWQRLTVTPGIRVELIASELDDALARTDEKASVYAILPGLGLYYSLSDALGLLAGAYRGFSPPPPGVDDAEPEYSLNYEAGARFTLKRTRAELIGFFNDYSNLTDTCTLSSGCSDESLDRQFDAGNAHIYGLQAFFEHDIPLGKLGVPFGAAYTFTHAEFRNKFQSEDPIFGDVERGDEMPYVPRHQLSAHAGLEAQLGGLNASVHYVSAMREQAGDEPLSQTVATDEQLWIDLAGKLRLHHSLELYVNVRNLLDARHIVARRPYGARPNAPRWIQVGIKGEL